MNELQKLSETQLTPLGFEEFPAMEFSAWVAFGHKLARAHRAIQWAAADWINAGEVRYAGKYRAALEVIDRKYSTLRTWTRIAQIFPFARRRANLSFSHHAVFNEFPEMPEKRQDRYLDIAEKDGLSVADLREMIRLDLAEVEPDGGLRVEPPSPLKYLTEFTLSLQTLGDPVTWPKPQKEAWKVQLRPVVEFYNRL